MSLISNNQVKKQKTEKMKATFNFNGLKAWAAFIVFIALTACGGKHKDQIVVPNPEISMSEATNIALTSVTLTALVTPNDLSAAVSFEVAKAGTTNWQTQPIVMDLAGKNLKGRIQVTYNVTGLVAGTDYIAHAKAVTTGNSPVVTNEVKFSTAALIIEGKPYGEVVIGSQTWMKGNLRVTKYQNGDPIATSTNQSVCYNAITGMYAWYNNDSNTNTDYGPLYNWYAINDPRKIAPAGWHVPTYEEYMELVAFLGGDIAGLKMIEKGLTHWTTQQPNVTNSSGLSMLPGGIYQDLKSQLVFSGKGLCGFFWTTSSIDYTRVVFFTVDDCGSTSSGKTFGTKNLFCSVRLIKDK